MAMLSGREEPTVAEPESGLTKSQLDALRRKLEGERSRIQRLIQAAAPPHAPADQRIELEETAQRETERSHLLEIAARERALLAEIDRALAKLDAGTYGVSEKTGDPIPYERLVAIPWARSGVDE